MVKILRVKPFATAYGGSGTIKAAPGAQANMKSGDNNIEQAAALLAMRTRARRVYANSRLGSKGNL
jgi:hypothetical protein